MTEQDFFYGNDEECLNANMSDQAMKYCPVGCEYDFVSTNRFLDLKLSEEFDKCYYEAFTMSVLRPAFTLNILYPMAMELRRSQTTAIQVINYLQRQKPECDPPLSIEVDDCIGQTVNKHFICLGLTIEDGSIICNRRTCGEVINMGNKDSSPILT